jgi:hypothetical protein
VAQGPSQDICPAVLPGRQRLPTRSLSTFNNISGSDGKAARQAHPSLVRLAGHVPPGPSCYPSKDKYREGEW